MSSNLKVNSLVPATGTEIGIGTTGGSIDFRCPATFGGNVTIGGTLTYDEVINIDSIGIITARTGLNVSSGTATFAGAIDANGDLDVDGHTNLDNVSIAGVTTTSGNIIIENAEPSIFFTDTNGNPDYKIFNDAGALKIYDTTYSATRLQIGPTNGEVTVASNTYFPNGITMNPGTASVVNTIAQRLGDTDTKIRFPAADTFSVETAGSERLRIASNGTIGINSTSPGALLDLSSSQPGILFSETGVSANNGKWLNQANASELYWQAQTDAHSGGGNLFKMTRSNEQIQTFEAQQGGVSWFTIRNSDKRVGINQASPRTTLDVTGYVYLGNGGQIQITGSAGAKGLQLAGADDGANIIGTMGSSGEHLVFRTASSERMRLLVGGPHLLLGGTTSVNEITETSSSSGLVIGNTSMGNGGLAIINSTSGTGRIYFGDSAGANAARNRGQINYYHNGDYMMFATAGTERLRIDSSGRVMVGSSTYIGGAALAVLGTSTTPNTYGCFAIGRTGANVTNNTAIANIRLNGGPLGTGRGAEINAYADANWSDASSHPTRLTFHTVASSSTSATERLRINRYGGFGLGGANFGTTRQTIVSGGASGAVSWSSNPFLLDMDSLGDIDYDGVFLRYREVNVSGNGLVYLGLCKSTTNCPAGRIGCPVGFIPGVVYNSQFRVDKVGITPWPDGSGHRYEYFAIISDYVAAGKLGIFYLTNSTN